MKKTTSDSPAHPSSVADPRTPGDTSPGVAEATDTDESGLAPLFEAVVKSSPDVVLIVDDKGRIVFVNKRCEALLGYSESELIGKSVEVLVPSHFSGHAELRSGYQENPVSKVMGHRPVLSAQHKSGTAIPVQISLSPLPLIAGHGRLVQAVMRDAMPHWQNRKEQLLQSVAMDAAANGIVITDARGVIEWVNPAVSRMTGYSSTDLIGRHTRLLKSGLHDDTFYADLWRTILDGKTWFGEIANKRRDGTIYHEEQHIAPVRDEEGNVSHFIAIKQDVTARKTAEAKLHEANEELQQRLSEVEALQQQLRDQAVRDPLTELYNRRFLDETLTREIARGRRDGVPLSVIMIDLDGFKQLNDTAGHAAGDAMLKTFARLLTRSTRGSDIACRWGGDEFLIVLSGAVLAAATHRAELLRKEFSEIPHIEHGGDPIPMCSLSLGVTQLLPDSDTPTTLLQRADKALYQAKQGGRNRVVANP